MVKIGVIVQKQHPDTKKQQDPHVFVAYKFEPGSIFIRICHLNLD